MNKNKYISIFTLVVFSFSYLGQSLHIISHNADGHKHKNSCCHHESSCKRSEKENDHQIETCKEYCPICEFHFIDFNVQPHSSFIETEKSVFKEYPTQPQDVHFKEVSLTYLLRGPPIA